MGKRSRSSLLAEMNGSERGLVLYFRRGVKALREDCPTGLPACGSRHSRWPSPSFIRKSYSEIETAQPRKLIRVLAHSFFKNSSTSLYSIGPSLIGKSLPFPSNDRPPLALPPSELPFIPIALQNLPTLVKTRASRSSIHPTGGMDNEDTFTTFSLLSLCWNKCWGRVTKQGIASGIGANSASAASCHTRACKTTEPLLFEVMRWTIPYYSFKGASLHESILTPQLADLRFQRIEQKNSGTAERG
ncbi:hypothetical protein HAX54_019560 [Datura stramonium]|uniref:Uncharacterized protein n=1 Tax=Datura stramonium TaxID=4076 RepID=A0ABS8UPC2_DATST|nr:hypothetical protein [Datura stramonium]